MIGWTLFFLGLVAPVVIMSPFIGAITRRVVFKRHPTVTTDARVQHPVVRAWKPLDLGPDLVRWPSETPALAVPHFPEPAWPSEGWNDPHFGRKRQLPLPPSSSSSAPATRTKATPLPSPAFAPPQADEVEAYDAFAPGLGSDALAGLDDAQVRGLIDREGLVKAVELLVERGGFDAATVAREIKRILGEARARRR